MASDAASMARAAHASRLAQQANEQAMTNAAASASANDVSFSRIQTCAVSSEAITEEETTEEAKIEEWKRSNHAARLRADLNAAPRHSPEIEGRAFETGGLRERIISRMQAENGDWGIGVMSSAMPVEMLDAQRDSDKEEMEADAVWPRKNKKEDKEDVPALEERKAGRLGRSKKDAFGLDGADERRLSPERTPLPPSRAASMATQDGLGSQATTTAATTSAWGAGMSPAIEKVSGEATRPAVRVSDDGSYSPSAERRLLEVVRRRQATVKSLLSASKADASSDDGGSVLLEVVSRALGANNHRRDRRERTERCQEPLQQKRSSIAPFERHDKVVFTQGPGDTEMEKEARVMAQGMIEEYEEETKALVDRLIELSTAFNSQSKGNTRVFPSRDLLDRRTSAEEEERREVDSEVTYKENIRKLERRFGKDMALELMGRLQMDMARSACVPQELNHPDPAVRNRFLLDTFPVDGEDIYFQPECLSLAGRHTSQGENTFSSICHHFNAAIHLLSDDPESDSAQQASSISDSLNLSSTSEARLTSALQKRTAAQRAGETEKATADQVVGKESPNDCVFLDPSLMKQRYLPRSASGAVSAASATFGGDGYAKPMTGREYSYVPDPVLGTASAPTTTSAAAGVTHPIPGAWPSYPLPVQARSDILNHGLLRGQGDDLLNFHDDQPDNNPLLSYISPNVLPDINRMVHSSLLRRQGTGGADAEGFSLEREVLASIAAIATNSNDEARGNEDAQAETPPITGRHGYQAAIDGGRTVAQRIAEDYAKEMRERTLRERDERILKRARQISGQHPHLLATRGKVESGRVVSHGRDGNDSSRSDGSPLESLPPLSLKDAGRQRLVSLRDDKRLAGSHPGAPSDLSNTPRNQSLEDLTKPQPWLTADRPRPDPPSDPDASFLDGYPRASSAAVTSQEKTNEEGKGVVSAENEVTSSSIANVAKPSCTTGILNSAGERKCTTFRPLYHESARCDGCGQTNRSVLCQCNTCATGQWDCGSMERDEVHNGRGLDWTSDGTDHEGPRSMAGKPVSCGGLKGGNDAGETLAKDAMAAIDRNLRGADGLLYNVLSNITGRKVTLTLSRKPLAKSSTAEASRPSPFTLAGSALVAEEAPSASSAAGGRLKKAEQKKTENADSERELDQESYLAYEEEFQELQSMTATQEERDQILRSWQFHDEKIAALKKLRVELAEEQGEADETAEVGEGRLNSAGHRAYETLREMEGCLVGMCNRALQPTHIPASERSETQSRYDAEAAEHDGEMQDLPGMTDQKMADKMAALKRLQEEFKRGRPGTDEPEDEEVRKDDPEAVEVRKRSYEHYCPERAEAAKGSAWQPKYIPTWQRAWGRSNMVEALSPLPARGSTLAKRSGSEIEKDAGLVEEEQTSRERLEERSERFENGMGKAMNRSVQDRWDGKGKGRQNPRLTRTITDMELHNERAKAFNEGNMAAFKDVDAARKNGFEEGVKSVMNRQISAGGSEDGVRSRAGQKIRYLPTILGAFKCETTGPKTEAAEGKAEDGSPDTKPLAKDGESMSAGGRTKEEGNSDLDPYGFWGLVQFDSLAAFVGPLPPDFPWQSETCNAGLFRVGWPNTLSSLKASLEDAVKKELVAMKATEGSPKISQAGNVGLRYLGEHRISGFTLLWNWRKEHIFAGEGMMLFSRTPCLRTKVTERNIQVVLREMSLESGKHVLLVHTAKIDKEVDADKKDAEKKDGAKNGDE